MSTDNLLVTAKTEDEISQLEIYVYDETQENLYVHHDVMLPNFPLCLEWLDFPPASTSSSVPADGAAKFGNYVAVGTLDPEIEIWSLDVVESMYPDMVLGRPDKTAAHVPVPAGTGKKKRKKAKARPTSDAHHVDAVLGLSWNRTHRHMLASASADRTVKLWDLSRAPTADADGSGESAVAIRSFNVHKDKVQAVQWNDKDPTVLLSGSYDRTVRVFDSRAPDTGVGAVLGADVEALRWDPWESHGFYVSPVLRARMRHAHEVVGLARKWSRAQFRCSDAANRSQGGVALTVHDFCTRRRCVRSGRESSFARMPRDWGHRQVRQGLERGPIRRGQAVGEHGRIERS